VKAWLLLGIAIVVEVIATNALKASDGFSRWRPSVAVMVGYGIAFYCLSRGPANAIRVARAGSFLRARQGRARECTSVHERVMTRYGGQKDPARRVACSWPPSGSAQLDLAASQACTTHYHRTATNKQRGLHGWR